jgi:hypothetical protein
MKSNQHALSFDNFQADYIRDRNFLIGLIKSINYKLRFKFQTFFLAVYYMDLIYNTHKITEFEKELIAITCLMLAGKYILI